MNLEDKEKIIGSMRGKSLSSQLMKLMKYYVDENIASKVPLISLDDRLATEEEIFEVIANLIDL